jgi:hypothetical protein
MFAQDLIPQMFSNIKSLFKLHHDFFLPRLEERLRDWEEQEQQERRIGDIMTSFAPFLKMYAEYVRNFDHATNLISTMSLKSPRFVAIIDEIQVVKKKSHQWRFRETNRKCIFEHAAIAPVRPFESSTSHADTDPTSSSLRNVIT